MKQSKSMVIVFNPKCTYSAMDNEGCPSKPLFGTVLLHPARDQAAKTALGIHDVVAPYIYTAGQVSCQPDQLPHPFDLIPSSPAVNTARDRIEDSSKNCDAVAVLRYKTEMKERLIKSALGSWSIFPQTKGVLKLA
ncbi:hypothetical protein llap_4283 [Limosa lapponica baueri]|uniref:Uncharacterized protein n=1 Tax=Limosa lapponica baueri TaxID=1758121 RepID=A0A2I0UH85_LIMLA|nr:hypothetical protein llap_4283 [Limosa lapponica baueri]